MLLRSIYTLVEPLPAEAVGVGLTVGAGVSPASTCAVSVGSGVAVSDPPVGFAVGCGVAVGAAVGFSVGFTVGYAVGLGVAVGFTVGLGVALLPPEPPALLFPPLHSGQGFRP